MSKDVNIDKTIEILRQREGQLATELLEARNCIATLERVFGDRPDEADTKGLVPTEPEPARTKKKKIWICKNCKFSYSTNPKANGCLNCKGTSFRESEGCE